MRRQRKVVVGLLALPFCSLLFLIFLSNSPGGNKLPQLFLHYSQGGLHQIGSNTNLAIYNVFLDRRVSDNQTEIRGPNGHVNGVLRIILVKKRGYQPRLNCVFDDGTNVPSRDLQGRDHRFYELTENHQRLYGGYSVHCDVPSTAKLARGVTIALGGRENASVWLPVVHASARPFDVLPSQEIGVRYKHKFAVCVPALHRINDLNTKFLSDWFNVHIQLGVTAFRVYYSEPIEGPLNRLLASLKQQVEINLYPLFWQGNSRAISVDSWYYLQTTTVNDCLLRSLYDTEFVFFGDLDEVLVPHHPNISTWVELADALWKNSSLHGLCFPAALFYGEEGSMRENIHRLSVMDRIRTKCLVRPRAIFEMGIHHISKPYEEAASKRLKVPVNLVDYAFVHHYHGGAVRSHNQEGFGQGGTRRVEDRRILRYL